MYSYSLHPTQEITLKVRSNIYKGPIRTMYQTFRNRKSVFAYYNKMWFPANIIMREVNNYPVYEIKFDGVESLKCGKYQTLFTTNGEITVDQLKVGDYVEINVNPIEKISALPTNMVAITEIKELEETTNWLFGIEILDTTDQKIALTNGIIVK